MRIYKEENLTGFDFWRGARDTVKYLTDEDLDQIEEILEDLYPDGMDETDVNDIIWHEADTIAEWLGYEDFEEIMNREEA